MNEMFYEMMCCLYLNEEFRFNFFADRTGHNIRCTDLFCSGITAHIPYSLYKEMIISDFTLINKYR